MLDAKSVAVVFTQRISLDLHDPSVQVLSVERLNPILPIRVVLAEDGGAMEHQDRHEVVPENDHRHQSQITSFRL